MLFRAEKCIDILKCKAYWLVSSSSLQSHIAYTPNLRKIKQLKQSAGGRGISISQDISGGSKRRVILHLSNKV